MKSTATNPKLIFEWSDQYGELIVYARSITSHHKFKFPHTRFPR
jgi:hypothetical protein